jgi:TRAP-type mannitol/chloroaromatic compound transport system permease large subunit
MKRELIFGLSIMAAVVIAALVLTPWTALESGHLGLLMLALVVVAIMLGFPTAFTLMGMGMMFTFFAYRMSSPGTAVQQSLDLMVQRAYSVMTNDVLISIPLFVFMGYLVERANLIEKLFRAMHLALARVPGSLAVATLITCAIFATATGIVGAVVTLMGLLAYPAMLKAGYSEKVGAGVITAGGCLGILIPPSVLLIVYGATAGVSVVQLYAGAFFPGLMLAGLYVLYVIILAKINPSLMPPLSPEARKPKLSNSSVALSRQFGSHALVGLLQGLFKPLPAGLRRGVVAGQVLQALLPAIGVGLILAVLILSRPDPNLASNSSGGLVEMSGTSMEAPLAEPSEPNSGLSALPESGEEGGLMEPPGASEDSGGLAEPPSDGLAEPPGAEETPRESADTAPTPSGSSQPVASVEAAADQTAAASAGLPLWLWVSIAVGALVIVLTYALLSWERFEVLKMLLSSFFPLAVLILALLGSIVFGLATPTEAAAVGTLGGALLALAYGHLNLPVVRESVFLTGKTTSMVCWLFVGSSIFSAAFALLGGQALVEAWVLSLGLTKLEFLILSQVIIFLLGWPLEWTEIIVIFMPIFIPLLDNFGVDPLFFGLLVALNLQTAFLSPPVAMSAFYLKGVAPPHVTLNQIFAGMIPFMGIQLLALVLLYLMPEIGMWLPTVLYRQ